MRIRRALQARFAVATLAVGVGVTLGAQTRATTGPLAPFGVSEARVQSMLLRVLDGGGTLIPGAEIVGVVQDGYERVPAAMRARATTAAFGWAKQYLSSPAFATAYARFREGHKPAGSGVTGSLDEAVQQEINTTVATFEASKKGLDVLAPDIRAKTLKNIDDEIARWRSPETARQLRIGLEAQRREATQQTQQAMTQFDASWPADPKMYVRKQLEYIMAATANIDYSLPKIWVKNPSGATVGFLSPGLKDLPWETTRAIVVGKESVDAAREAIAAWLQELPQ